MSDDLAAAPLLARILADLLHFPGTRGEGDRRRIERWLTSTEVGQRFRGYLADEAELLAMAANRLNVSGDEELRGIGQELGRSAERLGILVGTPAR